MHAINTMDQQADAMIDRVVAQDEKVRRFEREAVALAQVFRNMPGAGIEVQTNHFFGGGVYLRELRAPAGSIVIGHLHRTEYWNLVMRGKVLVILNGEVALAQAGDMLLQKPGVRKVGRVLEDLVWLTIHANPDGGQDLAEIEERIFDAAATEAEYPAEAAELAELLKKAGMSGEDGRSLPAAATQETKGERS